LLALMLALPSSEGKLETRLFLDCYSSSKLLHPNCQTSEEERYVPCDHEILTCEADIIVSCYTCLAAHPRLALPRRTAAPTNSSRPAVRRSWSAVARPSRRTPEQLSRVLKRGTVSIAPEVEQSGAAEAGRRVEQPLDVGRFHLGVVLLAEDDHRGHGADADTVRRLLLEAWLTCVRSKRGVGQPGRDGHSMTRCARNHRVCQRALHGRCNLGETSARRPRPHP